MNNADNMAYHIPVMVREVIELLMIKPDGIYIDCTLGEGGHTLEILRRGGNVLGIDVDENTIKRAKERIKTEGLGEKFTFLKGNFRDLNQLAQQVGISQADGILYDLGYSSYQLGVEELGISFLQDQALDMRLDKSLGVTAADLVNALGEKELARIFYEFSDEKYSKRFAKAIVQHRNLKKFQTTTELSDLIASVAPLNYEHGRIHPATRVFQALRIAVNSEIDNLRESLPRAEKLLLPGGRMAVISFHSLEDKTVKDFGRSARPNLNLVTEKPLVPSQSETEENIRSRSAKLRVFEKVSNV